MISLNGTPSVVFIHQFARGFHVNCCIHIINSTAYKRAKVILTKYYKYSRFVQDTVISPQRPCKKNMT